MGLCRARVRVERKKPFARVAYAAEATSGAGVQLLPGQDSRTFRGSRAFAEATNTRPLRAGQRLEGRLLRALSRPGRVRLLPRLLNKRRRGRYVVGQAVVADSPTARADYPIPEGPGLANAKGLARRNLTSCSSVLGRPSDLYRGHPVRIWSRV